MALSRVALKFCAVSCSWVIVDPRFERLCI